MIKIRKTLLSNAFFALLFMTILVSLAVILPRILLNNTVSNLRMSIGFIIIKYEYANNSLEINITNHYSAPIKLLKLVIENETFWVNKIIPPGNTTEITIPYTCSANMIDVKITYVVNGYEKTVWKRLFLQK